MTAQSLSPSSKNSALIIRVISPGPAISLSVQRRAVTPDGEPHVPHVLAADHREKLQIHSVKSIDMPNIVAVDDQGVAKRAILHCALLSI